MNFGGFLDASPGSAGGGHGRIIADLPYLNHLRNIDNDKDDGDNMPSPDGATIALQHHHPLTKSMFSSPGLSLALQTGAGAENHCDVNYIIGGGVIGGRDKCYEGITANRRGREDLQEHESRSGSDNLEGVASGDDQDAADNVDRPPRKKRYHRHTPQQIQELEALFKECPHPDEKQRLELSRRLCLEMRQVKFWFQNRRTQMKTQLERHENSLLRQENDKLRVENMSLRNAMRNPICTSCGDPAIIGEISLEEQHLRIENMRLKDELDRVCTLTGKFLGRPVSSSANSLVPPIRNSSLELGVGGGGGNNGFCVVYPPDFGISPNINVGGCHQPRPLLVDRSLERSMLLELALTAMDELLKIAQTDQPLWIRGVEGGREVLNEEEYMRVFAPPCIGIRPDGFVSESSRESGMVIINSSALIETLMDSNRWAEMFPCLIARTSITDVISGGMDGTRNGALQLMQAEMQVLSPLVPVREVNFLRFSKQHAEGVWAVVDVSVDVIRETPSSSFVSCRRLPSGCVVQDMPNGYSKVTWVEHADYDESLIHPLYRPLISSGMGFGAHRWVATLQRQCQCLAILMSSTDPTRDHTAAITLGGRRSMLKLAQRMMANFCTGVCASTVHKWNKLSVGNVDEDVKVMTRESVDDPGEPPGIVLSAATSVSLGVSPQQLFDFLRDEQVRSEWDILSNGGPMHEMAHISKGQDHGNRVSLLRSSAMNTNQSSMLILQETCINESGSLVVYAPVDIPAMHVVMNGGDSDYVALLPSGFAIVPDVPGNRKGSDSDGTGSQQKVSGSLLTVAFQILVNNLPTAKLTMESVETVNHLISCTIQKIKAALQCEG